MQELKKITCCIMSFLNVSESGSSTWKNNEEQVIFRF